MARCRPTLASFGNVIPAMTVWTALCQDQPDRVDGTKRSPAAGMAAGRVKPSPPVIIRPSGRATANHHRSEAWTPSLRGHARARS
jgi:hypothetical protein